MTVLTSRNWIPLQAKSDGVEFENSRTERRSNILLVRDDVKYVLGKEYVYFLKRVDSAKLHDQWTCEYSYATLRRVRAGQLPDIGTTLEAIRKYLSEK